MKFTYRNTEIEINRTHLYGHYEVRANYRGKIITAMTTDTEIYDYCDDDEPRGLSQTAATRRMMACRRRAYGLILERYENLYAQPQQIIIPTKYDFTGETKDVNGNTLHRICAIRDFGNVKAGDLGGWIESESNLSHLGDCWVADEAMVCGGAEVSGDAKVFGNAKVVNGAIIWGNAEVYGDASVSGDAKVYGKVFGNAWVGNSAKILPGAEISDNAQVYGSASIDGSKVCGDASVHGEAWIPDGALICERVEIKGHVRVCGAVIDGDKKLKGYKTIE